LIAFIVGEVNGFVEKRRGLVVGKVVLKRCSWIQLECYRSEFMSSLETYKYAVGLLSLKPQTRLDSSSFGKTESRSRIYDVFCETV
jgi:hypothetical protein